MVPSMSAITVDRDFIVRCDEAQPAAGGRLGKHNPFEPFEHGPELLHARNIARRGRLD
jgi:hypothetical protein